MSPQELQKEVARLESLNDQLSAELIYLDESMKAIGFEDGFLSLKKAIEEVRQELSDDQRS